MNAVYASLQHFQGEQRAFQTDRTQIDPQQVKNGLLVQKFHLIDVLPDDRFEQQVRTGLGDRATMSAEGSFGDDFVFIYANINPNVVTTEGILILI